MNKAPFVQNKYMLTFLHDDIVLHVHHWYYLHDKKRIYCKSRPEGAHPQPVFEFECYYYGPMMLNPQFWKRFDLTKSDIQQLYKKQDIQFMWQYALLTLMSKYDVESMYNSTSSTFQSFFMFRFNAKKQILDHMIDLNSPFVAPSSIHPYPKFCTECKEHKPLLPIVYITNLKCWESLKGMVPIRLPSFLWTVVYPSTYLFKECTYIPLEYHATHHHLLMTRIVKKDVFDQIEHMPKRCIVTLPVHICVQGVMYVLTEESFFLKWICTEPKKKGCKRKTRA